MGDPAQLIEFLQDAGIVKVERKKGRKVLQPRHKARYGAKPVSGSQVKAAFKDARQALHDLSAVLLRSDLPSTTGTMEEVNYLIGQLGKVEREIGLGESLDEALRWVPKEKDGWTTTRYEADTPLGTATLQRIVHGRKKRWVLQVAGEEVDLGSKAAFDHAEGELKRLMREEED